MKKAANTSKAKPQPKAITNRRAHYDYALGDEFVVGLHLSGPEVRAARDGHIQLKGAFVTIKQDELWLTNASFSVKHNEPGGHNERAVDTSPRKLLAHRKEIDKLTAARKEGMTIVPLKLLNQGRFIKLIIALGKGKKRYDKREALKKRDFARESALLRKRG
ncbi:SsrA-binding protein SmpB [Candidatus Saccharibacteria bacterium]|nr:SsrA-binding protein SmpB [Candidatus Saccharibacteria bacterium]